MSAAARGNLKTAAIYARYSSIMQKDSSIEGQKLVCGKLAKRNGLDVTEVFFDKARSGKSIAGRDGYAAMVAAIRRREFNVIIIEDLSRLSRDAIDTGMLKKICNYNRVEMLTQKGWQTDKDIAIHGLVSTLDNESRAINVRRGQTLCLSNGGVPGAPAYGYRAVPGKPGEHEINPETAKIVVRIFEEYASGRSPRAIAADLTSEGIPSPASHRDSRYKGNTIWNSQAFVGGMYAKGIIGNRKYIGEIEWNTHSTEENPDTKRKVKRCNPKGDHIKEFNSALRIISDELWNAAQKVRQQRAVKKFGPGGKVVRRPVTPRGEHLFGGLLRCGACNGPMRIANTSRSGTSRVACAAAHQHQTCSHSKSYDIDTLREGMAEKMVTHLTTDEAIDAAFEAFREERKLGATNDSQRKALERKLNALSLEIARLVEATMKINNPPAEFYKKIDTKEMERASLEEQIKHLGPAMADGNVLPFPPKFKDAYRKNVMEVHELLTKSPQSAEARIALANLIDSIVVHPTAKRMPYEITPYARLAAITGQSPLPARRSTQEVIAAQGLGYSDNAKQGKSVSS
ncbi:recombinase family protein [Bradyrhizobium valentinum]|nr:recombinase family protein [Bradyrhizobium valentinum]